MIVKTDGWFAALISTDLRGVPWLPAVQPDQVILEPGYQQVPRIQLGQAPTVQYSIVQCSTGADLAPASVLTPYGELRRCSALETGQQQ